MSFTLTSPAFRNGEPIPNRFTCDAEDVSPPLEWNEPPQGSFSFVIIHDDPDDTPRPWLHWTMYNIPGETRVLPEGIPKEAKFLDGSMQGISDFKRIGYGGPCPPSGVHHYLFKIYAIDSFLALSPGASQPQLQAAMKSHVLAEARLMGTYRRTGR